MIQLKVYDSPAKETQYWLDLYDTEPIKLTLSIEDITSADATSTFSKTFKVPGTRKNAEFFKNSFDVDGTMFDVTVKKPAEILVDGAEFRQGHVRLQKVYVNTELDRVDYELLFLGETRDFSSRIGDKALCELAMPDLVGGFNNGALDASALQFSWQAFPEGTTLTSGLHNGDIIYPLIDHGNTYTNNVTDQSRISLDPTGASHIFTQVSGAIGPDRFKPMIRARRILQQIFADAGYTWKPGGFFDSELFHQIYISAFGNNATVGWDNTGGTSSENIAHAEDNTGSDIGLQVLNQNVQDPGGNLGIAYFSGFGYGGTYYQLPTSGTYEISASAYWSGYVENSNYQTFPIDGIIYLYNMDATGGPTAITQSNVGYGGGSSLQLNSTITVPGTYNGKALNAGDRIAIAIEPAYGGYIDYSSITNVVFDVLSAPGNFNPVASLDCQYKQIDFVKDMLTAFRLVLAPDPNNPTQFIIEPWQTYINSGELYDWSKKLVENKDVTIEPVFFSQSDTIDFKFQPGGDYTNIYHQQAYEQPYGYLQFSSNNDLLKGKREVKLTGIAPTEVLSIQGSDPTDDSAKFIIPQLHTHSPEGSITQHLPIKPKTRMLFYNGLQALPLQSTHWYLEIGGGAQPLHLSNYPLVSPYQEWPIQPNTLNLNWANDVQYWGTISGYNQKGSTLFTDYWSRYISSLYNKYARRLTAYFVLNNIDLNYFSFDDTVFVNGTYYRPEKIIDVEVGAYTEVQVQLLTANDYRPPIVPGQTLFNVTAIGVSGGCVSYNGSISVTTEGTPGFTWQLSNGQSGAALQTEPAGQPSYSFTITDVPPGNYTLTVTDSLGRTDSVAVTVPVGSEALPTATHVVTNATNCNAPCNGQIDVTAVGQGPLSIYWYDAPLNTSFTRTGLCPGQYSYFVTDTNGCMSASYLVEVTCETVGGTVWNYAKDFNCEALSSTFYKVFVPTGTTPQPGVDYVTLTPYEVAPIDGCFTPIAETTGTPDYYINQYYTDCQACQGIQLYSSRRVENCLVPGDYKYINYDPNWPIEGSVVKAYHPDNTCYVVQGGDTLNQPNLPWAADFPDCESCATGAGKDYAIVDCANGSYYNAAKTYPFNVGDVVEFTINANPTTIRCGTIVSDVDPSGNQDATLWSPITRECGDDLHCNIPAPQQTCVISFGASMVPCIGGTVDEYMEGWVELSAPVTVDTQFRIAVGYLEGPNGNCNNQQYLQDLYVTVLAGEMYGLLTCNNGAPFISSSGATICYDNVQLVESPYPLC